MTTGQPARTYKLFVGVDIAATTAAVSIQRPGTKASRSLTIDQTPDGYSRLVVMTTGEGETMEAATNMAIEAMADLLMDQLDIDDTDAAMLIASAADVRAGLAGHAPYTMQVSVPKAMLSW